MRTCDAVGACMAVPPTDHYRQALDHGDTLGGRFRPHVHWARPGKDAWIESMRAQGWRSWPSSWRTAPYRYLDWERRASRRLSSSATSTRAFPPRWVESADVCVEIPMVGKGASLNVAVAGSLVLYRLAGLC